MCLESWPEPVTGLSFVTYHYGYEHFIGPCFDPLARRTPSRTLSKPLPVHCSTDEGCIPAQSRFRKATFTLVGGADADQFSLGAEDVHYEGPLQIRLQVRIPQP